MDYLVITKGAQNTSHCDGSCPFNVLFYIRDRETRFVTICYAEEEGARAGDGNLCMEDSMCVDKCDEEPRTYVV